MSSWDHVAYSKHGGSSRHDVRGSVSSGGVPRGWRLCAARSECGVLLWSCRVVSGYPIGLVSLPEVVIRSGEVPRLVTWEVWKMLTKSQFSALTPAALPAMSGDALSLAYPVLWSFLTQDTWEDATPRETGSLLLFTDSGVLKCMAKDKANGMCLWVSARSLTELLFVLDRNLTEVNADWRRDRAWVPPGQKNPRRK